MVIWHIWSVVRKTFKKEKNIFSKKYSPKNKENKISKKKKTKNIWEFINNRAYLKKKIIENPSGKSNIEYCLK